MTLSCCWRLPLSDPVVLLASTVYYLIRGAPSRLDSVWCMYSSWYSAARVCCCVCVVAFILRTCVLSGGSNPSGMGPMHLSRIFLVFLFIPSPLAYAISYIASAVVETRLVSKDATGPWIPPFFSSSRPGLAYYASFSVGGGQSRDQCTVPMLSLIHI